MTFITRLSAKGQIVIPKDVRERLGWAQGVVLDVLELGGDVVLRRAGGRRTGVTARDALREVQSFYRYDGPPVSIEDMHRAVEDGVRTEWVGKAAPPAPSE